MGGSLLWMKTVKREREKKTLILIHCVYLQLRKYIYTRLGVLTTIHVTYIKKERLYTIHSLYSTIPISSAIKFGGVYIS